MEKIRQQLEFYFCDLNVNQDKYLRGIIDTNEGYVPIETILGFVKMKELGCSKADIISAVESSTQLLLNEDKESIKRKTPIPTDEEVNKKSLFVKSFPKDATYESIYHCIEQFAKVDAMRMNFNRMPNGAVFNGTIFVEFANEEEKEKFKAANATYEGVALENKPREEKLERMQKMKKTNTNVNYKMEVSLKLTNRDIKNEIKNDELLRENITKYFVERTLAVHNMKHGTEEDKVEVTWEAKEQEEKGFKYCYVSIRKN